MTARLRAGETHERWPGAKWPSLQFLRHLHGVAGRGYNYEARNEFEEEK